MADTIGFPVGNAADAAIVFPYTGVELTSNIDILPNQWGLIGDLGMFEEEGVSSTVVELRYRDGYVSVLGEAERGTIPTVASGDQEAAVFLKVPHFPDTDLIRPEDLQDKFAFQPGDGQALRPRTAEDELVRRLAKIKLKHDLTREYLRMGAIKGKIYDGKGTLLYDLFSTFGITQQVFTFTFSDPTFNVQQYTYDVARYMELNLHGDVMDGIDALVSPEFFDALTSHPKVEQFWLNWNSRMFGDTRKGFRFGSINFIEYNAQTPNAPLTGILQQQTQAQSGMLRFIEADAGYAYPSGTRDSFKTYNAPPNVIQMVNKPGIKIYVSPKILDHGKGIELFSESNPLPVCRRPNVLCKLVAD